MMMSAEGVRLQVIYLRKVANQEIGVPRKANLSGVFTGRSSFGSSVYGVSW